jgi:CRP/FNR family cyclic AMP-dependent transcriptional regulator
MAEARPRVIQPLPLEFKIPRQRAIVRQGEPCADLLLIVNGAVLISALDPDGRMLGLDVAGPGDAVGGPPGAIADATARTIGPCRLRPAPGSEFASLLDARARRVAELACELAWAEVSRRVERRLEDLARRFGRPTPGGVAFSLDLTQEDLAALCGTSRETVNRALRGLEATGRIERRGRGRFLVRGIQSGVEAPPAPSCSITKLQVGQ